MAKRTVRGSTRSDNIAKITCMRCGNTNQANFYTTKDENRSFYKKIPYCKSCIKDFYNIYLKKNFGNMNLAIYYLCRKIDIPYIHSNYEGALRNISNDNAKLKGDDAIVSAYMKGLSFTEANGWGYTFDESQDVSKVEGLFPEENKLKKKSDISGRYEEVEYDSDDLIAKWGQYEEDDLIFLEQEYLGWCDNLGGEIIDKSVDVIVKLVCNQTLKIQKGQEAGDNVEKEIKTLRELMNSGGLIDINKKNANVERPLGLSVREIETHRPIIEPDPAFSDVDNMMDIVIGYNGSVSRTLGKNNKWTELFDKVYGKYDIDLVKDIERKMKEEQGGIDG